MTLIVNAYRRCSSHWSNGRLNGKCISTLKNVFSCVFPMPGTLKCTVTKLTTLCHSCLGVTPASDLTWNEHINQISSTANRTLAFTMRNLNQCPQNIKSNAYKSLVRPLLEYSSSVWDPHTKKLSCKIDSVQHRAARFCFNDFRSKSEGAVSDMINKLEWEPLANRRMARRLVIFHKALHGHLSIPLDNLAQPANRISRHTNSRAFNSSTMQQQPQIATDTHSSQRPSGIGITYQIQ